MPVQNLNIYIILFLISIGGIIIGIGVFYSGINQVSFNVYHGMEQITYYLDKNKYDLYMNGLIYCISFGASLFLLLLVIIIPSNDQIQKRNSSSYGTPAIGKPPTENIESQESAGIEEPELTPQIEDFSQDESLGMEGLNYDDQVFKEQESPSESFQKDFLYKQTESAVKFLTRKGLDDNDLSEDDETNFAKLQNQGLSRGELRRQVLKLMKWESIPDEPVKNILTMIKNKIQQNI